MRLCLQVLSLGAGVLVSTVLFLAAEERIPGADSRGALTDLQPNGMPARSNGRKVSDPAVTARRFTALVWTLATGYVQ